MVSTKTRTSGTVVPSLQRAVTIQDVARYARVSTATVSRVLNGRATVDEEMADRVRKACHALQYRPNSAARSLAGGRPVLLGVVVGDLLNPFFVQVIQGIEDVMQSHDYLLVLCNSAHDSARERKYIEVLCAERVGGVIIVPKHLQHIMLFQEHNIPVVTVDQRAPDVDAVLIDNVAAAREAVAHLIAQGYRRIGVITGPMDTTTGRGRLDGYRMALHDAGLALDPALEFSGPFQEEIGRQAVEVMMGMSPSVDAILMGNNRITMGALQTLHARGVRIPDDMAVVAFDDVLWVPPGSVSLTRVIQPAYDLGRAAAKRLVEKLQAPGKDVRQEIVLSHRLQIGDSSRARA